MTTLDERAARAGTEDRDPGAAPARAPRRLPGLFSSVDRDGRYRMASAGHREWFGLEPDQVVGRHLREILGERLYRLNRPHFEAALAGQEQMLEDSVRDRAGREHHFEITYVPDRGADGEVRGVFVQAMDVTSRVRAQLNLAEAQAMAGLGSWGWERDVGFHSTEEVARIAGQDPATWRISADAVSALVPDEERPALAEELRASLLRGEDWEARHRLVRPDGEIRHVHSRVRVELGNDGGLLRTSGTVVDVTAQTLLQAEVEAHNELLSDTMAMLGHDVRQPLTAVLGFLDEASRVLTSEEPDESTLPTVRACVERAARSGGRMRRLLDDILAMASVDAGTLVARPERVQLAQLLPAILEEVGVDAAVTGEPGVAVRVDLFHVRQALTNLLVNAGKYGRAPFTVAVAVAGDRVEVCVADEGDGVPEQFVPQLFQRFARGAQRARGGQSSTGLGLHLVHSLVEANGGTVTYAGTPGSGARFVVSLPSA